MALITIVTGALVYGGTSAFFSDTETSAANTFTAGAIDLKIDNSSYYNGLRSEATSWELVDLTVEKFFNFLDLKPDDYGEDTISFHVDTNDAYLCANVTLTSNDDNGINEPESEVDDTDGAGNGELAGLVNFLWWADDGDNVLETGEEVINQGNFGQLGVGNSYPLTLADSDENIWSENAGPVDGDTTYYIGKAWCFGTITPNALTQDNSATTRNPSLNNDGVNGAGQPEDGGFSCDGTALGNESQTDTLTADVTFEAVQARHNDEFQCPEPDLGPRTTLTLVKQVLDGEDPASAFTLFAEGPTDFSGAAGSPAVTGIDVLPGSYDLSETGPGGYAASNWSCVGGTQNDGNTVTLAEGEQVTCTISNFITCTDPTVRYADSVVSFDQGVRHNGSAILPDRTDPLDVLNAPQHPLGAPFDSPVVAGSFYSLGFDEGTDDGTPDEGGKIVIEFTNNYLVDGPGNDLKMWEVTGGTSYPVERIKVEVSQDNSNWFVVTTDAQRDQEADLALSGLSWARYVRVTDTSVRSEFNAFPDADGYDLDAFSALTCANRTVVQQPS